MALGMSYFFLLVDLVSKILTYIYAFETGQFQQSKRLLQTARRACEQVREDTGLILAEALHFEAWMHVKLVSLAPARTPQEAVDMTKQALDLRLHRLSPDDPAIGASYGNLAMLTVSTGDYEESLRYCKLCLDIRMKNEANETENISCTYLYYGWCYAKMGKMDKPEEYFKRAIEVMRDRFSEGEVGRKSQ